MNVNTDLQVELKLLRKIIADPKITYAKNKRLKGPKVVNYFDLKTYPVRLFTTDKDTIVIVSQLRDKSFVWAEVKYYIARKCVEILHISPVFWSVLLKELLTKLYHTNYIIDNDWCCHSSYPPQLKQDFSCACYEDSISLNVIPLDAVNDRGLTFKDWITYTFGICKPVNGKWIYELEVELKDYSLFNCNKII